MGCRVTAARWWALVGASALAAVAGALGSLLLALVAVGVFWRVGRSLGLAGVAVLLAGCVAAIWWTVVLVFQEAIAYAG